MLHLFFGAETRYLRAGAPHEGTNFKQKYLTFERIDPHPLTWKDFVEPLTLAAKPRVILPAIAYAMVFLFGSVLTTILIPQLFPEKFHFNTQQVGLQFVGLVIGSILGEQIGGWSSDAWMARRVRRTGLAAPFEHRLWLSFIGYALTICGVWVFLVQVEEIKHFDVTPTVGAAVAAAGNQIVTTVLITYAVDCYREEAASVGVFITFVRQAWGFIGPFW